MLDQLSKFANRVFEAVMIHRMVEVLHDADPYFVHEVRIGKSITFHIRKRANDELGQFCNLYIDSKSNLPDAIELADRLAIARTKLYKEQGW